MKPKIVLTVEANENKPSVLIFQENFANDNFHFRLSSFNMEANKSYSNQFVFLDTNESVISLFIKYL